MIRINLLPVREGKKQARLRVQAFFLGVSAAAGVGISVGVHVVVAAQAADKRAQIQVAQQELAKLAETRKEVDRYRAEEEEIQRKLNVIDKLERGRTANVRVMDEISRRVPERMWLTELTLKEGELTLKGISIDAEIVAQFLSSLEEAPDFSKVELDQTSLADYQGLKLNSFTVRTRYGEPAEPAQVAQAPGRGPAPAKKK